MTPSTSITLITPATINSTSTSAAVAAPEGRSRWAIITSVGTITGTNPTLDITVQHSFDATNWITLIALAQLVSGSANTTIYKLAAAATDYLNPVLPFIRTSYTIGGTASPTFNTVAVKMFFC